MTDSRDTNEWQQCAPGDLGRVASTLRARRTRREALAVIGKAAAAVAVIVVAVLGVQYIQHQPAGGDMDFGGISCSEVGELSADYLAGRLAPDVADKFEEHLKKCPMCRERIEDLRHQQSAAVPTDTAWSGGRQGQRLFAGIAD